MQEEMFGITASGSLEPFVAVRQVKELRNLLIDLVVAYMKQQKESVPLSIIIDSLIHTIISVMTLYTQDKAATDQILPGIHQALDVLYNKCIPRLLSAVESAVKKENDNDGTAT
jgi:hypothetical protein